MDYSEAIATARGDRAADLVLKNARVVDVLAGETYESDIAIQGSLIVGVEKGYEGQETIDLEGRYVCPGLIDAHVHIESSMVTPREFARAVVPHGVTTVITNPHEIANVLGVEGIRFMVDDAADVPLDAYVTIPSCVPASHLATSGAELNAENLKPLCGAPGVIGLGEVMNFPGVVAADPKMLDEIDLFRDYPVDGHCPGLSGKGLNAYVTAGITSDHECIGAEEAKEKLRLGMRVFIREGSAARNLKDLIPLVTPRNERWVCFCTDDRHPADLLRQGSIDHVIRLAIGEGLDPVSAIRMATLNSAEHFRLFDRGFVGPGRKADLVVFSDLQQPTPEMVFQNGRLVARDGSMVEGVLDSASKESELRARNTMTVDLACVDLSIPAKGEKIRVIGMVPGQLFTEEIIAEPRIGGGLAISDPERDILKMAVIERHRGSCRVGLGFVRGFGLKRGALASTVAHDHHNLMVIGVDDQSMLTAAGALAGAGGGQCVAKGARVLGLLPLPIAGIMSDLSVDEVRRQAEELHAVLGELGTSLQDPFMPLSFMGLEVIPNLKLTDLGLVDVTQFKQVDLFVE
ncbi:MAG: adenine deaminase [Deltaproteobacteria bacterium]|nr:adenine deaminase [Deltaproteobacteria bacterium]